MTARPGSSAPDTIVATWRSRVLRRPGPAAEQLRKLLDSRRRPSDVVAVDLEVLVAEALHRSLNLAAAEDASYEAVQSAGNLDPPDWTRLAVALIVRADIAVCARDSGVIAAATDAAALVADLEVPDPVRLALSRAPHAVAVYHHEDGEQGRLELALLLRAAGYRHADRCGTGRR